MSQENLKFTDEQINSMSLDDIFEAIRNLRYNISLCEQDVQYWINEESFPDVANSSAERKRVDYNYKKAELDLDWAYEFMYITCGRFLKNKEFNSFVVNHLLTAHRDEDDNDIVRVELNSYMFNRLIFRLA